MQRNPLSLGIVLAILAALAFGVTTPFIQRLGAGLGPFTTASILYFGAALGTAPWPRGSGERREAPVAREHLPRLLLVAVFGAALAPTLFSWGLQRVPAAYGSLLLNSEAIFTVGLAALVHREHVGTRVWLAALLMFAGGAATVAGASAVATAGLAGSLAVVGAVFCWAVDNVLTRPLADLDPAAVVRVKALCGALMTGTLAFLAGEPVPAAAPSAGLLLCGATGYGLSLRLYLLAQRRIGAGRTGSVFAVAPFVGALVAVLLGDRGLDAATLASAALFLGGVFLHVTEQHHHEHAHEALFHDHAHLHDDGHHDHPHPTLLPGPHSHPHHHDPRVHAHAHGPDSHHGHGH
jgi:drug/metabolite transporter (DMT)-like permease